MDGADDGYRRSHTDKRVETTVDLLQIKRQTMLPFMQQPPLLPIDTPGQRIRAARIENHMTIRQVASLIQISTNSRSLIENEKSKPSLSMVRKLSALFNKEIWYLGTYERMPEDTLGQRIRKARYYRAWIKQDLADYFKIEAKSVYNWEADKICFSYDIRERLNSFLKYFIESNSYTNKAAYFEQGGFPLYLLIVIFTFNMPSIAFLKTDVCNRSTQPIKLRT
ncbi:helix-turn-helix transcriptional regulator [Paenibacillus wenxiniae]|uniref:Helix-turn-helix transcriptional regulator n=1 Tax=Paenibacillus wenxiniae TaxID=1636843 RepID=A0ABW4RQT6_9BACL